MRTNLKEPLRLSSGITNILRIKNVTAYQLVKAGHNQSFKQVVINRTFISTYYKYLYIMHEFHNNCNEFMILVLFQYHTVT